MSFKRPRLSHYGIYPGQVIVQNGLKQLSPLDRKRKPLEEQKQLSLNLSSDDREGTDPTSLVPDSSPTDCVINFKDAVRGVYSYRILSFSFVNNFYSIQTGLNDLLEVVWTVVPSVPSSDVNAGIIRIPEGFYNFSVDPRDFVNPLLVTPMNLNDIKLADRAALVASYPTDIRVALLNAADGAIDRIITNRILRTLQINWVATSSPTINTEKSTSRDVFGFAKQSTSDTWFTIVPVNANGPTSIALESDVLNNNEIIDPDGPTDFFLHIPITVPQGQKEVYIPPNPPLVTFNSQSALVRVPIRIVDHKSHIVLKGLGSQWEMIMSAFSADITPASS